MSQRAYPLLYTWTGDAFEPRPAFRREADKQFVIGQVYRLAEVEERSETSHRHLFAALREAWLNLPEDLATQFPTVDHFRKRLLIEAGFFNERILEVGSNAAALRVAAFARETDEFAVAVVRGPVVVIRTAKSQKHHAMDKAEFQASKTAILDRAADLIGVTSEDLSKSGQGASGANNPAREVA